MIYAAQSKKFAIYVSVAPFQDLALHMDHFHTSYKDSFPSFQDTSSAECIRHFSYVEGMRSSLAMQKGPSPDTGFFRRGLQITNLFVSLFSDLAENKSMPRKFCSTPPQFDTVVALTDIAADAGLPSYHLNSFLAGAKTQTDAWKVVEGALEGSMLHEQYTNKPGVYFFTNTGKPHFVKSLATGFACNQCSGIVDAKCSEEIVCPAILVFFRDEYFQCPVVRNEAHLRSLLAPLLCLDERSMNDECPICLESMGTTVHPFLCGHSFCIECAGGELSSCPLCRCAESTRKRRIAVIRSELVQSRRAGN